MNKQELKRLRELCGSDSSTLEDVKPTMLAMLNYIEALENVIKNDTELSCKTCIHEHESYYRCPDCADYVEDHWEFGKGQGVCFYNSRF